MASFPWPDVFASAGFRTGAEPVGPQRAQCSSHWGTLAPHLGQDRQEEGLATEEAKGAWSDAPDPGTLRMAPQPEHRSSWPARASSTEKSLPQEHLKAIAMIGPSISPSSALQGVRLHWPDAAWGVLVRSLARSNSSSWSR